MISKGKIFLLFAIFAFAATLNAQILEPVKWTFSQNKISDDEVELVFTAKIDPTWHLYSQDIPMTPPATSFMFNENPDVEFLGGVIEESKVIEEFDPNFDMVLKFFANEAIFKQKVKVLKQTTVTGSLEYMCCDDTKCLPPTEVEYSFKLKSEGSKPVSTTSITTGAPVQGILEPVKWDFSSEKINDQEYELIFTASIDPTWHLYSQDIPMAPPATTFSFTENGKFELVGNVTEEGDLHEEYDPNFEMELKYFSNKAVFKQRVKINEGAVVKGFLEYMCCDDTRCLPPEEVEFEFALGNAETLSATEEGSSEIAVAADDVEKYKRMSIWAFFFAALGGGLIALLTPCIYPMIPLTVS